MLQAGVKVWPCVERSAQDLHAVACRRHSSSTSPQQTCSRDQQLQQRRCQQRSSVCCSAASVATGSLPTPADDSFSHPYHHQQQVQPTAASGAAVSCRRQLLAPIRKAASQSQLLELLQDCSREQITPDFIQEVLFQASRVARSTQPAKPNSSSSSSEGLAAQQLVCACLQLLLQLNEQISGRHLSNCLLSLGVLCGRGGPASPVMAGAVDSSTLSDASILQQQQQSASAGVLQHLLNPARSSRRDLEALLRATGPQHQLQQLLHLTRHTSMAAAQPQQLVDMLYGLAVLPLRPAPDVLSLMLQSLQDQLQRMHTGSSSDAMLLPTAAAAGAGDALSPKQLSQLLWSAATLQLHLPNSWLDSHWAASMTALPLYSAQDVANTCWALASLKQQQQAAVAAVDADAADCSNPSALQLPPGWQSAFLQQATTVAGALTAQGVSNTLWGLAVLQAPAAPQLLLVLLQRAVQQGSRFKPQELANTVWGAARCLQLADQQQQVSVSDRTAAAAATAADLQEVRQQLQQLLQQHGPELSHKLQPRDWSNIIWGAGLAGVQPGRTLLQALWRKTPARFSTSLNPHAPLGSSTVSSSRSSSSDNGSTATAASIQAVLANPTLWSPQALANTLWGCARLRVLPSRVWLQGFEAASVAVLAGFGHQQLANTLWAFGEMRHPPSDAWLQLFWKQAADLPQRLSAAAAATAGGVRPVVLKQQQQQQQQLLLTQQQHVCQVLQACGRLRLEPPVGWLHEAAAGLIAAAEVQLAGSPAHQQQQQQQQTNMGTYLHSCAGVVFALAELAHGTTVKQQSSSGSSSRTVAAVAVAAGQQLLRLLSMPTGHQQQKQQQDLLCQQLQASDTLALLLALPKLQLQAAQVHALGAALLLRAQQQQQQLSASQAAQFAYAAAVLAHGSNCSNSGSDSNSSSSDGYGVWQQLHEQSQAAGAPNSSNSSNSRSIASVAAAYVDQVAVLLTQYSSSMSAVDLRFSLAAVAKLHTSLQLLSAHTSSSSRKGKGRAQQQQQPPAAAGTSAAVAAFTAAAGAAVGNKLGDLTPHQRSVVAASLATLGFSPQLQWLDMLLHYSSCDLSGCSNGDLVRLVQALPLLLAKMQRTQQQQQQLVQEHVSAKSSSRRRGSAQFAAGSVVSRSSSSGRQVQAGCVSVQQQQALQDWWSDWLSETEVRLDSFSTTQLVGMVQGVARLAACLRQDACSVPAAAAAVRSGSSSSSSSSLAARLQAGRVSVQQQQQQQLAVLALPVSWQDRLLQVLAGRLPRMGAPELLLVLSAVRWLGVTPGQDWCAAVAAEAAGRAAAAAASGAAAGALQVHHVGWLALYLQRLGYVPPAEQQAALLWHVSAACEVPSAAAGGAAAIGGRQLWQLLVLLPQAGWLVEPGWVQGVQGSAAGQRLRAWLGQRQRGNTWQQLWARLLH